MNSTSIGFDRDYFTGKFNSLAIQKNPILLTFLSETWSFFDNLCPVFVGYQNICIVMVTVLLATKNSNPAGSTFELKYV